MSPRRTTTTLTPPATEESAAGVVEALMLPGTFEPVPEQARLVLFETVLVTHGATSPHA